MKVQQKSDEIQSNQNGEDFWRPPEAAESVKEDNNHRKSGQIGRKAVSWFKKAVEVIQTNGQIWEYLHYIVVKLTFHMKCTIL